MGAAHGELNIVFARQSIGLRVRAGSYLNWLIFLVPL
jgi:hypothetical protein